MVTSNTRLRRIEDRLSFLMEKINVTEEYLEYEKQKGREEKQLTSEAFFRKMARDPKHVIMKIESMLCFLLNEYNCLEEFEMQEKEKYLVRLKERHELALLQENNEELKSKARVLFANQKRRVGDPVWVEGKYVYIDPPESRRFFYDRAERN